MKTIEFSWREMDKLAALIAALEAERVEYSLQKDSVAIAITIGKRN